MRGVAAFHPPLQCVPTITTVQVPADLTIAKNHTGAFTQGDVGDTYTITVSNTSRGF